MKQATHAVASPFLSTLTGVLTHLCDGINIVAQSLEVSWSHCSRSVQVIWTPCLLCSLCLSNAPRGRAKCLNGNPVEMSRPDITFSGLSVSVSRSCASLRHRTSAARADGWKFYFFGGGRRGFIFFLPRQNSRERHWQTAPSSLKTCRECAGRNWSWVGIFSRHHAAY